MGAIKNQLLPLPMTTVQSSGLTASYVDKKTLEQPAVIFRIINDSTETVLISYNGADDHDAVDSGQTLQLEVAANREPQNECSVMHKGMKVYMKGTAGTGNIYIAGYYHGAN